MLLLGLVHRDVGALHQPLAGLGVARVDGDPDRGARRDREVVELERAPERLVDARRDARRGRRVGHDHAELIATEARDRLAGDDVLQPRADLAQQLVAGAVAERVVQFLEAVEVDDQQREAAGAAARGLDRACQLAVELTAVGEAGEVVGARLALAHGRQPPHVVEGHREAQPGDEQRGARQARRHDFEVHVVAAYEQEQRDRAGQAWHEHRGDARGAGRRLALAPRPGRQCEQAEPDGPHAVEQRARAVGAFGDLEQVDAVGDRHHDQPERDQQQRAARAPAGRGEDPEHEHDQHQVGELVGEARRQRRRSAVRRADHRLEHDRRTDGGERQRADRRVEADGERQPPRAHPHEAAEHREHEREEQREQQVAEVRAAAGVGRLVADRAVQVAGGEEGHADPEQQPGAALALDQHPAGQHEQRQAADDDDKRPLVDQRHATVREQQPAVAEREQRERARERRSGGVDAERDRPPHPRRERERGSERGGSHVDDSYRRRDFQSSSGFRGLDEYATDSTP